VIAEPEALPFTRREPRETEPDANGQPFTRRELRDAIPERCFHPSTARSLVALARDVALLAALYLASARATGTPWLVPMVFLQGTLFWALFVIGHDCGHGAFSRRRGWNAWVGHLTHTPLLVPYHAWRLSHRIHHRHTGDVARDQAWPPLTRREARALPPWTRFLRLRGFLLVFPLYLLRNGPGRAGSHFDPGGPLFSRADRPRVRRSVAACAAMALGLLAFAAHAGPAAFVQYWLAPWLVFAAWAAAVTWLHHNDPDVPWYRGAGWSSLRGALATIERHYGPFEWLHHDAGCHVVHHLFPRIPHYRLREASRAVAPILGEHLRRAETPAWRALWRAMRDAPVVPETGERVRYEPLDAPRSASSFAEAPSGPGSSPATR